MNPIVLQPTLPGVLAPAPQAEADVPRKAMRGVAWSGVQNIANNAVSFATYAMLARLLPPKDFGLLAFATVFTVFMQLFVDQGIPDAVVQRASVRDGHLSAAFWFNMAVSSGLTAILWLGAPFLAGMMHDPRLSAILRWLAPLLIFSALGGIQQAILKRALRYKMIAFLSLLATAGGGVIAVVCAFRGYGVWSLVAQQLGSAAFTAVALWVASSWRPSFQFSLSDFTELTHFSIHVTSSAFLDFFNRRADDFLIGYFLGPIALGYYSLAYRLLLTFTRIISSPFNSVAFSAFSRLQHDPVELQRLFKHLAGLTAWMAFPTFLGLAAIAPDFIHVLFGAKWETAAPVLRILCFIGILHSVAFLHGTLFRAAGHANWQMWFTLVGAVTNVIGFCYFVRFGVVYVAGWYVTTAYLLLGVDLGLVKKLLGHTTGGYLRGFAAPASKGLAVAGTALLVKFVCPAGWPAAWRFALELLAGSAVFAVTNLPLLRNPLAAFNLAPSQSTL